VLSGVSRGEISCRCQKDIKGLNLVRQIKVICQQTTGHNSMGNEQDVRLKPFNLYDHALQPKDDVEITLAAVSTITIV
jgi:hypothetical protein